MAIVVCATVAIVAYLMYCFSPEVTGRIGSNKIYYTAFFVVIGVLRYLQLTLVYNKTESPTRAPARFPGCTTRAPASRRHAMVRRSQFRLPWRGHEPS